MSWRNGLHSHSKRTAGLGITAEYEAHSGALALSGNAVMLEEMILDIGDTIAAANISISPAAKIVGRRSESDEVLVRSVRTLEALRKAISQFGHQLEKEAASEAELRESARQLLQAFERDIDIEAVLRSKEQPANSDA